ncbi:MAG: L,D-transpeptidase [Caulobacteraceae bacterium]
MPRSVSIYCLGAAIGALAWLTACSDPAPSQGQATTQAPLQKAPVMAKVAPQEGPVVPAASSAPSLALDTTGPDAAGLNAAPDPVVREAQAEPAAAIPAPAADLPPLAQAINQAVPQKGARAKADWSVKGADPALVRAEVLLDRAGFSPGVIDGKTGENLKHAVAAYASAHGLSSSGALDQPVWDALTGGDAAPVAQSYQITAEDEAGPFIGDPPKDYEALAKLPALGYSTPLQMLAEKFHMDQGPAEGAEPGGRFQQGGRHPGDSRPAPGAADLRGDADRGRQELGEVRAYDASGKLTAYYPASVGSTERPAPSGNFTVRAVAPHPAYYYDPKRLTFEPLGAKGALKIAPGPNNPVGATWIALNVATYGIHGSPDPTTIGKRQSHGCVRLTNWDAIELGKAVRRGVKVQFLGQDRKT